MVVTGGYPGKTRVSTYLQSGWARDLPYLNTGRFAHGCTFYQNEDGTKVKKIQFWHLNVILLSSRQFWLVAAGQSQGRPPPPLRSSQRTLHTGQLSGVSPPPGLVSVGSTLTTESSSQAGLARFLQHSLIHLSSLQADITECIWTRSWSSILPVESGVWRMKECWSPGLAMLSPLYPGRGFNIIVHEEN